MDLQRLCYRMASGASGATPERRYYLTRLHLSRGCYRDEINWLGDSMFFYVADGLVRFSGILKALLCSMSHAEGNTAVTSHCRHCCCYP